MKSSKFSNSPAPSPDFLRHSPASGENNADIRSVCVESTIDSFSDSGFECSSFMSSLSTEKEDSAMCSYSSEPKGGKADGVPPPCLDKQTPNIRILPFVKPKVLFPLPISPVKRKSNPVSDSEKILSEAEIDTEELSFKSGLPKTNSVRLIGAGESHGIKPQASLIKQEGTTAGNLPMNPASLQLSFTAEAHEDLIWTSTTVHPVIQSNPEKCRKKANSVSIDVPPHKDEISGNYIKEIITNAAICEEHNPSKSRAGPRKKKFVTATNNFNEENKATDRLGGKIMKNIDRNTSRKPLAQLGKNM